MSLSRAFTTRRLKLGGDGEGSSFLPRRSNTTKADAIRSKISAPVELIHTTNMLSYNAPDLPHMTNRSTSGTSSRSEDDSESLNTDSTPPTSPDVDRYQTASPEPNHLTCYFEPAGSIAAKIAPPAIPQRSPSHTKKTSYEALTRQAHASYVSRESDRSVSSSSRNTANTTFSRSASTSTQASSVSSPTTPDRTKVPPLPAGVRAVSRGATKEQHPFGQELAQVSELAEEYAGAGKRSRATVDEDEQTLSSKGLLKFSADDYIGALQGLTASFFPERSHVQKTPMWI